MKKQYKFAESCFNTSIKLDPSVVYYYISKGFLFEEFNVIVSAKLYYGYAL